VPTKLWVLMNDDELTCILALGKIALFDNNGKWTERST